MRHEAEHLAITIYLSMVAVVGVLGVVTTLVGLVLLVTGSPQW